MLMLTRLVYNFCQQGKHEGIEGFKKALTIAPNAANIITWASL